MINASLSEYLVTSEYYGPPSFQTAYESAQPSKEVTFLGIPMEGNFSVITDVINKVTWDYGPRESLPEMVEVDSDEMYTSLVKLYDAYEFMDLVQSSYDSVEE
jgi:hypothetical protein